MKGKRADGRTDGRLGGRRSDAPPAPGRHAGVQSGAKPRVVGSSLRPVWAEGDDGRRRREGGGGEEKRGIGRRRVNVQPVEIKIPPRKTSLEKVGAPAHFSFSFSLFPLSFFSDPSAIFHHRSFFSS